MVRVSTTLYVGTHGDIDGYCLTSFYHLCAHGSIISNTRFDIQNSLGLGSIYTSILSFFGQTASSITHHPVLPSSYPSAVRNPYLSAWMPSDRVQHLPYAEPQFWTGQELGWSVIVRVNGQAYSLMGVPDAHGSNIQPATVQGARSTATRSIFDLTAGPVEITLDLLSPVSPSNYIRQSLPFSGFCATKSMIY